MSARRTIERVIELSEAMFEQVVLRAERPVVVDFWAPWCRPCEAVEPILAALADEHGADVTFARLNVDAYPGLAARYGVFSLPTVVLFAGGEAREAVAGARGRAQYERAWRPWLRAAG